MKLPEEVAETLVRPWSWYRSVECSTGASLYAASVARDEIQLTVWADRTHAECSGVHPYADLRCQCRCHSRDSSGTI